MISIKLYVILVYCLSCTYAARTASFPIGGLFNNLAQRSSFRAFENKVQLSGTRAYHGRFLDSNAVDSYSTALELCPFTSDRKGIVALIDVRPTQGICDTVCLLCNRYNISHLSVGWQPPITLSEDLFTFSYFPPLDILSKAYSALIKDLQWDRFTIFYEDEGVFLRLLDVINSWSNLHEPIIFRKIDPNEDNREIFKQIFKVERVNYHILDCDIANAIKYFQEITQIDNSTEYQSFILSNLNSYKLDLSDVPELMANVSTLHLTAPSDDKWKDIGMEAGMSVSVEAALTADALDHVERAISKMILDSEEEILSANVIDPPAICYQDSKADYEEQAWPLGSTLRNALVNITANGFTGNIEFNEEGERINFKLHYSKLNKESQFIYAGKWDSKTNKLITENEVVDRSSATKSNSKLKIVTKQGMPYFDTKVFENGTSYYRGYAVDLMDHIFQIIKAKKGIEFEYEFHRTPNDKYGSQLEGSKKWDGIIGELIEHKADLAVCDLTITSERNEVVDFSIPFMTLGISMLMSKGIPEPPKMFSFLEPLSLDVWLYLATTYIVVSFILLICARMSQDDWVNPHPCNQNPENLQNIWSLYNCMWLTMGAIMCQGCDILPRSVGSRWIAGMWWFFALIVTSSYTANMSTFLSDSRRSNDIKDVKELSEQNKVAYGAVYNASTYKFFEDSKDPVYMKLWSVMQSSKPTVFMNSNVEGTDRVNRSKGNYAFFMESTAIEYVTKRNCDLKMVGAKLDSKEYGVAFPKKSPRKLLIDFAILTLQEKGTLEELKKKWWEIEDNDAHCSDDIKEEDSGSLQMKNTSGIFLVLGLGGILGFLVAIVDFLLHVRQISVKEKVTYREAFLSEWRASLNPKDLHKLAAPPRSAPPSTASPSSSRRERSQSRAVSVLRAATSLINFNEGVARAIIFPQDGTYADEMRAKS